MTNEEVVAIIEQLRNNQIDSYNVSKEHFQQFRTILAQEEDVKDFRGVARHRGETVFTYEPGWSK